MTTREALHRIIDELRDDQVDLARAWIEDLRDAIDTDGPLLNAETLSSLDRAIADVAAGRVKSLDDYERERGL